MLLFSTVSLAIAVPIILWLTHHWLVQTATFGGRQKENKYGNRDLHKPT